MEHTKKIFYWLWDFYKLFCTFCITLAIYQGVEIKHIPDGKYGLNIKFKSESK